MGEDKRELDEQLDRLQEELPQPAAKPVRKLRRPDWKWVRLPAGVLLLISGVISSTPALNSRFAAGLALLAIDVPFLRKPTARLLEWGLNKWEGLRARFGDFAFFPSPREAGRGCPNEVRAGEGPSPGSPPSAVRHPLPQAGERKERAMAPHPWSRRSRR
jgi:hypothetical protein